MSATVPPDDEALQFARSDTGRVHILSWIPGPDDEGWEPAESGRWAEALMAKTLMLCGLRLFLPEAKCGGDFADDDLCSRCIHALGDQQWRAFHADSRGAS
jgi:hypothetical protein